LFGSISAPGRCKAHLRLPARWRRKRFARVYSGSASICARR
jgi:hypothetical protein